jgi:hypothetical protein
LLRRHHADLSSVIVNHADFASPDTLIYSNGWTAVPSVSESSPLIAADTISS